MAGKKQFDVTAALYAAMAMFWEQGWAATSMDDICTATGLGKGSLYATFGSKDDLFRLALERYSSTQGARFEAAIAAHAGDPKKAARAFFDVVLARIADPTCPGGCLVAVSAATAPTLTPASRAVVQTLLHRQTARLRATFPPDSDPDTADRITGFVIATNQALAVMDRAGATGDALAAIASTAVAAVPDIGAAQPRR